jgi:hypothetical protein
MIFMVELLESRLMWSPPCHPSSRPEKKKRTGKEQYLSRAFEFLVSVEASLTRRDHCLTNPMWGVVGLLTPTSALHVRKGHGCFQKRLSFVLMAADAASRDDLGVSRRFFAT